MPQTKPVISVSNLSKDFNVYKKRPGFIGAVTSLWNRSYETVHAVADVSFDITQGEVVGFIGQNGAGKTTTLKMLSGLLYPSAGDISILGYNPWHRKPAFQKQFSLVMGQKNQLWWDLPPIETFLLNKAIYEIPDKQYKQTLHNLTDLLDVSDSIEVQTRKLSLGQRMKCELIASLLHNPKVLFLDEPTIGLDVVMQKTLRDFIREYNKHSNATVMLTSHYMDDVKELCERAIIIDSGKKIFDGKLRTIIDTYARNKIISLTFAKHIPKQEVESFGTVKDWNGTTATILVDRKSAGSVASQVLSKLPTDDITIEEAPIEAIIRDIFKDKKTLQSTQ